jgi:hypothetical protein
MKKLIKKFTFDPANRTVTFREEFALADFLLITNVQTNQIIYNFADPAAGGIVSGKTLTLDFDTAAMSASDPLQIFIDVEDESPWLLRLIYNTLMSPLGFDKALGRQRGTVLVESGTITTVSNLTTIDALPARLLINGSNASAWADTVRARIT